MSARKMRPRCSTSQVSIQIPTLRLKAYHPFQDPDLRPKTTRDNLFRSMEQPKDKAPSRRLTSRKAITLLSCRRLFKAMAVEAI